MKARVSITVVAAALLVAACGAHAAPSALAEACVNDVKSVCGDVKPGGGKLAACMKEHFSELSEDCQIAYIKVAAVGRACRADVEQFCAGVGLVAECIKSHASQISAGCRDALAAAGAEIGRTPSARPPRVPREQSAGGSGTTVVPMVLEGGTFVIPVRINDQITLNFVIDSGASDVSVPADVVMTLRRTGTISDADFLGNETYQLADGSKIPSQRFVIRSLKVGDRTLENVIGSIAPVEGSMLLGQSFLRRFKSWSIDNHREALILN